MSFRPSSPTSQFLSRMSLRHIPRQPESRDVRLHEPTSLPHLHPPHINGNSTIPTTPSAHSNGSNAIVSPTTVATVVHNGVVTAPSSIAQKLAIANEQTWLVIGRVAEQMGDLEHAVTAYENALRHNPMSLSGLTQVAGIARIKEDYPKAVDYFQRVLGLQEENGEVWSALGHCYLMQDDLQKAYSAYQQALYLLPNPKEDPKLWYGIGILYDRYGSLDHAEEAFASVLRMDKDLDFDKANEILFRLGIIYKQQGKHEDSLACFDRILRNPPSPLAHADIWFQIGHVYEQQKDHERAKDAYERVVVDNPTHAKVLQQLGWLYHQDGSSFQNQDLAIQHLTKSLEADSSDAQSWYLLGRAYMAGQKYNKAYEAYQQAVYRDGRNPTFWCSIGVLYFQINQFRDALDAYSRAIRINPYISEVWFDLGSLYESCNNQISDAIDAYARANELDPGNPLIGQRLQLLKTAQATGGQLPAAPGPQDVHPTAYATAPVPPSSLSGPPLMLQSSSNRPIFRSDSRGPHDSSLPPLPPPSQVGASRGSPGAPEALRPFRGGPPPPVILDESRHMHAHTPLAPMAVDRPSRDYPGAARDGQPRGPAGQSLLLHHPVPQQQLPPAEDIRNGAHGPGHHQESFFTRPHPRPPSGSVSPPHQPNNRPRSPPPPFQTYPSSSRQPVGPAQPSAVPSQRSPRPYSAHEPSRSVDQDMGWDRRGPPPDHRDWDYERRQRHAGEYQQPQQPPPPPFHPSRSPPPSAHHAPSPQDRSPRTAHPSRAYWGPSPARSRPLSPPAPAHEAPGRRYDPRHDARDHPPPPVVGSNNRGSESPLPTPAPPETSQRRRRNAKDKEDTPAAGPSQEPAPKKERKKRATNKRAKEESLRAETPKPNAADRGGAAGYKIIHGYKPSSPGLASSNGSGSGRSVQPSPTSATPAPPARVVDEDYDEGVADALMGLAAYRAPAERSAPTPDPNGPASHSPTISSGSRRGPSPHPPTSHRGSVSSTRSRASPLSQSGGLKRPHSPGPDEAADNKRSRMEQVKRRASSQSGGRHTPIPSTRPSPIPFRTQPPASHSPEARVPSDPYPASPTLPAVFPPHPRPVGPSHATQIALPPIATLSPASTAASPVALNSALTAERDERKRMDGRSASPAPSSRAKIPADAARLSRSPPKHTPSPPHAEKMETGP